MFVFLVKYGTQNLMVLIKWMLKYKRREIYHLQTYTEHTHTRQRDGGLSPQWRLVRLHSVCMPGLQFWLGFQLPDSVQPGRRHVMVQILGFLSPTWEPGLCFEPLALDWPSCGYTSIGAVNQKMETFFSFCLSNWKKKKKSCCIGTLYMMKGIT